MQCFAYFPSLVYREECPDWVAEVKNKTAPYLDEMREGCGFSVLQTNSMVNDPSLAFLRDAFFNASVGALKEQGYDLDRYDFFVNGMWGQEISSEGEHTPHVHANTQMCGLYFLDTPKNGAYPVFKDPRFSKACMDLFSAPQSDITNATTDIHFDSVRPGSFLIFNSWLPHSISKNMAKDLTKFIHFTLTHREK
jgi:uncharacterized protein (TIGR02466 family)